MFTGKNPLNLFSFVNFKKNEAIKKKKEKEKLLTEKKETAEISGIQEKESEIQNN